jgi:hypothetical protein
MSAAPLICEFPAPRGIGFYSDEPIERHPNRWLGKKPKFKARESRGVRLTSCTPQRQRAEAQRRNWTIYEAIDIVSQTLAAGQVARAQDFDFFSWSATA